MSPATIGLIRGPTLKHDVELRRVQTDQGTILLLGICEGLVSEREAVAEALREHAPAKVALGLEPEMLDEIGRWEPSGALDREDKVYKDGLSEWGTVELPPPTYRVALTEAETLGASTYGIDLDETTYMAHFTEEVSVWDLFAKTWRLRRLGKKPPKADTPEAFCIAFDQRLNRGSFQSLEDLREVAMADRARDLADGGTVAVILPIPRLDGVARHLQAPEAQAGSTGP